MKSQLEDSQFEGLLEAAIEQGYVIHEDGHYHLTKSGDATVDQITRTDMRLANVYSTRIISSASPVTDDEMIRIAVLLAAIAKRKPVRIHPQIRLLIVMLITALFFAVIVCVVWLMVDPITRSYLSTMWNGGKSVWSTLALFAYFALVTVGIALDNDTRQQ